MTLHNVFRKVGLNQTQFALEMKMPHGTFANKLSDTLKGYSFNEKEYKEVLSHLERKAKLLVDFVHSEKTKNP
jgi:hypothetical protein